MTDESVGSENELDRAIATCQKAGYVVQAAGPYRRRMDYLQAQAHTTHMQKDLGQWMPAIPEPLFVGFSLRKARCDCGETFRNRERYREHYALRHVLAVSA